MFAQSLCVFNLIALFMLNVNTMHILKQSKQGRLNLLNVKLATNKLRSLLIQIYINIFIMFSFNVFGGHMKLYISTCICFFFVPLYIITAKPNEKHTYLLLEFCSLHPIKY